MYSFIFSLSPSRPLALYTYRKMIALPLISAMRLLKILFVFHLYTSIQFTLFVSIFNRRHLYWKFYHAILGNVCI